MDAVDRPPAPVKLTYTIAGGSPHSGRYVAEYIREDKPEDQSSRWSGNGSSPHVEQWILLRLESLAVLKTITFGKFFKSHPCNMKEFKVFVGLSEDSLTEVLFSELKNDSVAETFSIRSTNQRGLTFPTQYIKIQPLSAHGHSFHTSIWHVALNGIVDERYVSKIKSQYEEFQEQAILRFVLKHLRQRRFLTPFESILERTGLQLEHPLISSLHTALVLRGDFASCETTLGSIASAGLFSSSLLIEPPQTQWNRLHVADPDGDVPSARGGHAMCIDDQSGRVYLFGGWDGQKNLDDFWEYDIQIQRWRVISYATQREPSGPSPRSCHKMLFDASTGCIYLFGQLDDSESGVIGEIPLTSTHSRGVEAPAISPVSPGVVLVSSTRSALSSSRAGPHAAELYRYHTRGKDEGKWEVVSYDTAAAGGPPLVFDHQMVIDTKAQIIYLFGGRVVDGDWESMKFTGLFSFDIRRNKWSSFHEYLSAPVYPTIPSRFGHAMVLDHKLQTLFILGGQREDRYMSDMYAYHIPSETTTELFSNFALAGGPDPCFTHRAVIDPDLREIYVFCGLTRSAPNTETILESGAPYWIYRYEWPDRPGKWTKMVQPEGAMTDDSVWPVSRYAHQVVYDSKAKAVYMHGGNAGLEAPEDRRSRRSTGPGEVEIRIEHVPSMPKNERLNDFWTMRLIRPSTDEVSRRGKYLIRQQQFRELCEDSTPIKALSYLQTEVSAVVDHSDAQEAAVFRSLLAHLLSPSSSTTEPPYTRKRSREDSPVEAAPGPEDDPMAGSQSPVRPSAEGIATSVSTELRSVTSLSEDPGERKSHVDEPVSAARYAQRREVFEQLMKFVNADAKQPDKDLVRLINVDSADVF